MDTAPAEAPVRYGLLGWLAPPTAALAVAFALLFQFSPAALRVPLRYRYDAFPVYVWTQALIETGWWMSSDRLGAPGRMEMYDYPANPHLHFALMKLLALKTHNPFLLVNTYFLLSFPLVTLTCLLACRSLGLARWPAAMASLLFAFLPYHFIHGSEHLFLAAYFMVPLLGLVALWIARSGAQRWSRGRWLAALAIGAAAGFDFPYYPVFGCFFFVVAGLYAAMRSEGRPWRPLVRAGALTTITLAALAISVSPNLIYQRTHGKNSATSAELHRSWADSELYALKLTQMLMPVPGHRIPAFAHLGQEYRDHTVVASEGASASLGLVGSAGLLGLLVVAVIGRFGRRPEGLADALAVLTLAAILLATLGGFGCLFSLVVCTIMRSYVRMVVFIGFFALMAVGIALTRWQRSRSTKYEEYEVRSTKYGVRSTEYEVRRVRSSAPRTPRTSYFVLSVLRTFRTSYPLLLLALLTFGLFDQTGDLWLPPRAQVAAEFASDAEFVGKMEAMLPCGARVFQLPQQSFLDDEGGCARVDPYTQARGFLHSHALRWSFGATTGRPTAQLQETLAALPMPEFLEALCLLDFEGIYLDRLACRDRADAIEHELAAQLGPCPLRSVNGQLAFYPLTAARAKLIAHHTPEQLAKLRDEVAHPVIAQWSCGFDGEERSPDGHWRWCRGAGRLTMRNLDKRPRRVVVSFEAATFTPGPAHLFIAPESGGPTTTLLIGGRGHRQELRLQVPPGQTTLIFRSDAKPGYVGRPLVFGLWQYRVVAE